MTLRLYAGGTIIPTRSVGVRFSLSHLGLLIPVGRVHSELGSCVQRTDSPYSQQDRPASAFLARPTPVILRLYDYAGPGGTIVPCTRSVAGYFDLATATLRRDELLHGYCERVKAAH